MTNDYRTKTMARLNMVLDQMATAEPEDIRHLALAAKNLADIEQAARGGNQNGTPVIQQLIEAALANGATNNPAETKIPDHLQEQTEKQDD